MKRWALLVVALYLLVLLALTLPLLIAAFYPSAKVRDLAATFSMGQYWIWLAVTVGSQAVMLFVPVAASQGRPLRRRSVIWPVLASGLMMGLLVLGAIGCALEFFLKEKAFDMTLESPWRGFAIVLAVWLVWTFIFYRVYRGAPAMDVVTRQCRYLLRGSILELLVAVPTHVVARYRDYCCAGALTFAGIAFGLSVMIFSFGPGVFFLFVQRWKQIHPHLENEPGQA